MRIIQYPHPTLAHRSKPLRRVDAELHKIVAEMFDLMYENKGVGLAANQVDLPYRLFIMNQKGDPAIKEAEHVFLNPVLSNHKGMVEEEEGCLSLPGTYAPVKRPEKVMISGYDMSGNVVEMATDNLVARIVQHETDHLDGVMFINRLSPTNLLKIKETLEEFTTEFQQRRMRGEIPSDAAIAARWAELENLRT